MNCHVCRGPTSVWRDWRTIRCPVCLGIGIIHCCDGLIANEPDEPGMPPWWETPFEIKDYDDDDEGVW